MRNTEMADKKFRVTERELIEGALAAREGRGWKGRGLVVEIGPGLLGIRTLSIVMLALEGHTKFFIMLINKIILIKI